jgi:ABC-type sugar transport system ATPase subunit
MASLELAHVTKLFAGTGGGAAQQVVRAVDNVSLRVADGQFVALLGPSGCGKTTTLRMVAGLELPNTGQVQIGEREVTYLPARDRDIAMVFQDYALYPHMTVMENVGYPLKVRGIGPVVRAERVRQVAAQLQIDHLLERRPGQLSGGQQQRVALARAVVHRAQVTLFDEPLSNLDTKLRLEARGFLKRLQREVGITSVYVTHDQAEAMALADQIVVMNAGRVMQVGAPIEVYRRPANTFVASFIGSPPMNLLPASVDGGARRVVLPTGEGLPFAEMTDAAADALAAADGTTITLGIRPEHIALAHEPSEHAIRAEHYVTQELGSETIVLVRVGAVLLSVRVEPDSTDDLPDTVWLRFHPSRLFVYGADGALLA